MSAYAAASRPRRWYTGAKHINSQPCLPSSKGEYQFLLNELASLVGLYAVAGARRADEGNKKASRKRCFSYAGIYIFVRSSCLAQLLQCLFGNDDLVMLFHICLEGFCKISLIAEIRKDRA